MQQNVTAAGALTWTPLGERCLGELVLGGGEGRGREAKVKEKFIVQPTLWRSLLSHGSFFFTAILD